MSERVALPPELSQRAFTYDEARAMGVGEGRLRNPGLRRPFRGIRAPASGVPTSGSDPTIARCRDLVPHLVPGQFFSHITAASLWDIPLPFLGAATQPIHVTAIRPRLAPRMIGVVGHHSVSGAVEVVYRYGLPVSDPATTWLRLATVLSRDDLVAAADHMVLDPPRKSRGDPRPFVTIPELQAAAHTFRGRGSRNLSSALPLVRQGAASRTETLLRLLLARARLPEPALNVNLYDSDGEWLGRADLVWAEWRTIAEYDGDQHRTSTAQYEKDISRVDRFIEAGWRYVRVRRHGLFEDPLGTVARVVRALKVGGWHP